jgi:hypothetical protein
LTFWSGTFEEDVGRLPKIRIKKKTVKEKRREYILWREEVESRAEQEYMTERLRRTVE